MYEVPLLHAAKQRHVPRQGLYGGSTGTALHADLQPGPDALALTSTSLILFSHHMWRDSDLQSLHLRLGTPTLAQSLTMPTLLYMCRRYMRP